MPETMTDDNPVSDDEEGGLLNLFAKFSLSVDSLTDEIRKRNRSEQARLAPLPRSFILPGPINLNASGQGINCFGGPVAGREWIVRELMAVHTGYQAEFPSGASATGAAGALTSVSTTTSPQLITGFDVTIGAATTAGNVTVTLSGVQGGPYSWTLSELVGSGITFTKSLNLYAYGTATLTVTALTGGGVVSLNLYATGDVSPADITWYQGQNPMLSNQFVLPPNMARARMHGEPAELTYTSDVIRVLQNEQWYAAVMNGPPNSTIFAMVKILDQPAFAERGRVASQ